MHMSLHMVSTAVTSDAGMTIGGMIMCQLDLHHAGATNNISREPQHVEGSVRPLEQLLAGSGCLQQVSEQQGLCKVVL